MDYLITRFRSQKCNYYSDISLLLDITLLFRYNKTKY